MPLAREQIRVQDRYHVIIWKPIESLYLCHVTYNQRCLIGLFTSSANHRLASRAESRDCAVMSQIRSYPKHVTFIFRHKVSISKDKMSPNQTFSIEKMEKLMRYSPFMPLALPQYCNWATSVRQRHLSASDICPTAELGISDRCRSRTGIGFCDIRLIKFVNSDHIRMSEAYG